MFFTRIWKAPKDKTGKKIHANKLISNEKSICNTWARRVKKLLNLLEERHQTGKKRRKIA